MSDLALTLEDILAAARALGALHEAGADDRALERAARRLLAGARIARRRRALTGRADPRFGDGSLAAAASSLRAREGLRAPGRRALLLGAATICQALERRLRHAPASCP